MVTFSFIVVVMVIAGDGEGVSCCRFGLQTLAHERDPEGQQAREGERERVCVMLGVGCWGTGVGAGWVGAGGASRGNSPSVLPTQKKTNSFNYPR